MVFLGKNLNMSIVASIGYCIEVVGKEGHGALWRTFLGKFILLPSFYCGLKLLLEAIKL